VLSLGGDEAAPTPQTAEITPPPAPPAEVAPSQIITPAPAPADAAVSAKTQPAKKQDAKPAKKDTTPHRVAKATPKATSSDVDDTASRRPGGDWFGPVADTTKATTTPPPTTTVVTPPTTTTTTRPTGVSGVDGPQDPYGPPSNTPSADGDKKAEFYANVGQQQLASGDTAGAAASFKKALELDPKHAAATTGMGEIALRQGLFGDAIAHLKKASRLAPKSSYVFTLLGEAYLGTGNSKQSADAFKKALQLDPDNTRARDGFNEAQSQVPPAEDD
jgi:predicted Zn-dependent protease